MYSYSQLILIVAILLGVWSVSSSSSAADELCSDGSVPSTSELLDNACTISRNKTLRNQFAEKVKSSSFINGSVVLVWRYRYVPMSHGSNKEFKSRDKEDLPEQCINRTESEVLWCLHVWHPTEEIKVCLNGTGTQYTSPVAEELGIANDLKYEKNCQNTGCLRITYGRLYYNRAFLSMSVNSGQCVVNDLYMIAVTSNSNIPPSLLPDIPPHTAYAEIGKKLMLECKFNSPVNPSSSFATWINAASNNDLTPLYEPPNCTLESKSSLCNKFDKLSPTRHEARRNRIRSYVQYSKSYECDPYRTVYIYLVIDDLQFKDEGNYTCYATSDSSNPLSFSSYSVMIKPVFPVYQPLIVNNNGSAVSVHKDQNQFFLTCEIEAGFDTEVYWELSNGVIPEISFVNSTCIDDCYVTVPASSQYSVFGEDFESDADEYKMNYYRQLLVQLNDSKATHKEVYKCVVKYNLRGLEVMYKILETTVTIIHQPDHTPIITSSSYSAATSSPQFIPTLLTQPPDDSSINNNMSIPLIPVLVITALMLFVFISVAVLLTFIYKRSNSTGVRKSLFRKSSSMFKDPSSVKDPMTYRQKTTHALNTMFFVENKEIARNRIEFINKIDEGSFGQVMKASLRNEKSEETDVVAIKMVKESAFPHVDDIMSIKEELDIMRCIKYHPNIVNMIGYCTSPDGPLCIIMEFIALGNLRDYLRSISPHPILVHSSAHTQLISSVSNASSSTSTGSSGYPLLPPSTSSSRHTPLSIQLSQTSTHSYICFSSDTTQPTCQSPSSGGMNTPPYYSPVTTASTTSTPDVSPARLLWEWPQQTSNKIANINFKEYALQIAEGLSHLQAMNVIHCDLAARNILINHDFTLKIGDFGMAKILGQHKDYFRRSRKERIPVKWTAPEALEDWKYTHKSDIWSYGILLWEMVTFGSIPYTDIPNRSAWDIMVSYLKEGHRLQQPANCPDLLYEIMNKCWAFLPEERPTAKELADILSKTGTVNENE